MAYQEAILEARFGGLGMARQLKSAGEDSFVRSAGESVLEKAAIAPEVAHTLAWIADCKPDFRT